MMKPILLMSCAALLATVPLASASCHWCVGDVVDDCASLEPGDCAGSAVHLGTHAPEMAQEVAREAAESGCEEAAGLALTSVALWFVLSPDSLVSALGC